jgi:pyruvate ferredoxin oxidoreductase beta subunit
MNLTEPKRSKPLPSARLLGAGTPRCAGCGGLKAAPEVYDLLGATSKLKER